MYEFALVAHHAHLPNERYALSQYRVVAGRGNIRGTEGPRNAVATGLVLSMTEGGK